MNCCPFLKDKEMGTGKLLTQRHKGAETGGVGQLGLTADD